MRLALRVACVVGVFSVLLANTAAAQSNQPVDKRTIFTFSGPVSMPGVTLPAGEYAFRLADPDSTRMVTNIQGKDGKSYGMFFSIPVQRAEADKDPQVGFIETPSGTPPAVRSWWYAGDRTGYEFIYPKAQARKLAATATAPVLTTKADSTTPDQTRTGELARVSSSGTETSVSDNSDDVAANTTAPRSTASSASTTARAPVATSGVQETQVARRQLPKTATTLPLVLTLGAICFMAAGALWSWRTARTQSAAERR